jgi:hypothetical protein
VALTIDTVLTFLEDIRTMGPWAFLGYDLLIVLLAVGGVAIFYLALIMYVHRKRREVVDLTKEEFEVLQRFQAQAEGPDKETMIKPEGKPLFHDRDQGPVWIYKNGIKAKFVTIEEIKLVGEGLQRRFVVRYDKTFYPFDMIAGIYPIRIRLVRNYKEGAIRIPAGADDERNYPYGTLLISAFAMSDGPDVADADNIVETLQVETNDYKTAVLCPDISGEYSNLRGMVKALGIAMGPEAKQKVRLKLWLQGFYMIFEEAPAEGYRHGLRSRIMMGDIHKHYALRALQGYPLRRMNALRTMKMTDIGTLDERLRSR